MLNNKSLVSSANYLTDLNSMYSKNISINKNNIHIPNGIQHTIEATIGVFDRVTSTDDIINILEATNISSNTDLIAQIQNIASAIDSIIADAIVANTSGAIGSDIGLNISIQTDTTILKTLNIKVKYGSVVKYDIDSTSDNYIQILTNAGLIDINLVNNINDVAGEVIPNIDEILLVDDKAAQVSADTLSVTKMKNEVTAMRDETIVNSNSSALSAASALDSKNETQELYDLTVVAKNSAQSSASEALSSEQNADISEANAKSSELIAIQKASESNTSALSASSSASLATTKATEADASASSASVSASNALSSANASASSASSSASSANSASTSASSASASATAATIKANEAMASATSALSSANTSTAKATEASNSANIATTKASEASASASSALSSADSAIASASAAVTKASEALQSASNASASAINAEASNQSAISARDRTLAIELRAEGFADDAEASKNLAEKWASEKEDVVVDNGKYSARHYALKAEYYSQISGSSIDDSAPSGIRTYSSSKIENDLNKIGFDTTADVAVSTGQIAWNATEGTYDMGLENGSVLQAGQENIRKVTNNSGALISGGTLVMFNGTNGASGRINVKPFTAGFYEAIKLYGVATQSIASNADGIITIEGKVRGINTTGASVGEVWADNDILYAKPNDNGRMTKIAPADNELKIVVASVIKAHHANGILEIRFMPFNYNAYYTKAQNDILLNSKVPLSGDFILDLGEI